MLKFSLYQNFTVSLCEHIKTHSYRKNQSYRTDRPATSATGRWLSPRQEPCVPYALSRSTSEIHRFDLGTDWRTDRNDPYISQFLGETFRGRRHPRPGDPSGARSEANHGLLGRRSGTQSHRERQAEREESERGMAASFGKRSFREYLQSFFIHLGAGYRRIRKRPKGKPSPQLYAYRPRSCKNSNNRKETVSSTSIMEMKATSAPRGYVPYGWQFRGENVYIPSERGLRLNIFGMIDRNNRYEGFSTTENMTADKVVDFFDRLSLRIRKNTFVVLDNASVHRCKLMRELRPIWEKRGLFLFFLPPYSPHLNIAETLWRILKGKWLKPADYCSTDSLIYATNRALAALGSELNINFAHAD